MAGFEPWLLALLIIILVVFLCFVVLWVVRAHQKKVAAGREELIGKTAVVAVALCPKGVVFVEDERWSAVVDKGQVEPEEEVIITKVDGLKLIVTKKEKRR
jgi:membrane-bound serine protease (ClpP class)